MTKQLLCFLVSLLGMSSLACVMSGCGQTLVLSAQETKDLLRQLPYRYEFRDVPAPEGAEVAIAGRAIGRHRTILNFGIALATVTMGFQCHARERSTQTAILKTDSFLPATSS
jgi:hypothetical protein